MSEIHRLLEISKNNPIRPSHHVRAKFVPVGMYIEVTDLPADTLSNYRYYRIEPVSSIIGEVTARRLLDDLVCHVAPSVMCRVIDLENEKIITSSELRTFDKKGVPKRTYIVVIHNINDNSEDTIWLKDVQPEDISASGLRLLVKAKLNRDMDDFDYLYSLENTILSAGDKGESDGSESGSGDGVQAGPE